MTSHTYRRRAWHWWPQSSLDLEFSINIILLLSNLNFNILSFYDSLGFIPTGIFPTSSHSNEWKIAWPLDWLIQRICFVQFKCYSFVIYNLITILISKICRNLVLNKMLLEHRCILFKFADLIPHHRLNYFHIFMKILYGLQY